MDAFENSVNADPLGKPTGSSNGSQDDSLSPDDSQFGARAIAWRAEALERPNHREATLDALAAHSARFVDRGLDSVERAMDSCKNDLVAHPNLISAIAASNGLSKRIESLVKLVSHVETVRLKAKILELQWANDPLLATKPK
jgi:hypothetical protein